MGTDLLAKGLVHASSQPSLRNMKNLFEGHCSLAHGTSHCHLLISTGSNSHDNTPEIS